MKTILSLFLGALTFSSSAEIIIYKTKLNYTTTGAGTIVRGNFTGFAVYDTTAESLVLVKAYTARGRFSFETPPTFNLKPVSSGAGKSLLVLQIAGKGSGNMSAKGATSPTDIGTMDSWQLPKVMTITGTDLYNDSGEDYATEFKGTFTYDKKDTGDANFFGYSMPQVLEMIRDYYKNTLHYTEE